MNIEEQRTTLSDVWRNAAKLLFIRIEAPYILKSPDNADAQCVAFLPDFGGPNGMVLDCVCGPLYQPDGKVKQAAEFRKLFYSFISFKMYEHYREGEFKEALTDWGFFGDESRRPEWLKKLEDNQK